MGATSLNDTTFDKINFLRALKLMPKNKRIHARWEREMEKNLIVKNNISDCIVFIEKLTPISIGEKMAEIWTSQRVLRPRKKPAKHHALRTRKVKKCCSLCEK